MVGSLLGRGSKLSLFVDLYCTLHLASQTTVLCIGLACQNSPNELLALMVVGVLFDQFLGGCFLKVN